MSKLHFWEGKAQFSGLTALSAVCSPAELRKRLGGLVADMFFFLLQLCLFVDLFRTISWIYTNQKRQSGNDTNYHDLQWRSGYNRPQKSIFVLRADVLDAAKKGKCEHWASGDDSCFVCLVAACLYLFLQVKSGRQSVLSQRQFTCSGQSYRSCLGQYGSRCLPSSTNLFR